MVDIHCHILPCVDDGSGSIDDSIKMLKIAAMGGTKEIVATPHSSFYINKEKIALEDKQKAFSLLNQAIEENNIPIKLYLGEEVFFEESTVENLNCKRNLTINETSYVLTEFDFYEDFSYILQSVDDLLSNGYIPIIAHPERYRCIYTEKDNAFLLKEKGALLQLNSTSVLGYDRKSVFDVAMWMIDVQLADFVSSDAHSPFVRTTDLSSVHEHISTVFSIDTADALLTINPQAILAGEKI